jgi:hypothetical protein
VVILPEPSTAIKRFQRSDFAVMRAVRSGIGGRPSTDDMPWIGGGGQLPDTLSLPVAITAVRDRP